MREHGIPFSVLAVVTRETLRAADELWEFFASNGMSHIGFNIDEKEGRNEASSLKASEHLEEFRKFMSRIADLQAMDSRLQIRELEDMRRHLTAPLAAEVERSDNRPGAILNIDVDGNLTTFSYWAKHISGTASSPGETSVPGLGPALRKVPAFNVQMPTSRGEFQERALVVAVVLGLRQTKHGAEN